MREFNTSGPNIPSRHYTIRREKEIIEGIKLVENERYFTIWAPRQTGKSTYFRQLASSLDDKGYKVAHINFENYKNASLDTFLYNLKSELKTYWNISFDEENELAKIFDLITEIKDKKCVLIIDEVEEINQAYFSDFLHSIRNAYHSRETHCLKSVILAGVSNILGGVSNNVSFFNIADNLNIPYFTNDEVYELLGQHESETGQLFDVKVKDKISEITANQPGLVNGFAKKLVDDFPDKKALDYDDYLKVEDWYLTMAIDKNFANILNKANEERNFVERLLFTDDKIPFKIDRPSIKLLHTNGLIKDDGNGFVAFWVPFYRKRLYDAFYPYMNGEQSKITQTVYAPDYFDGKGNLKFDRFIGNYKAYVKRRGFGAFREKDETGNYKSIKEVALIYSFETFIHAIVNELKGKIYREANTSLGKTDMIINIGNNEFVIETKNYYSPGKFVEGKSQLAYYANSLNLKTAVYLVFCPNNISYPEVVKEQTELIEGVEIMTSLIEYDEVTWD